MNTTICYDDFDGLFAAVENYARPLFRQLFFDVSGEQPGGTYIATLLCVTFEGPHRIALLWRRSRLSLGGVEEAHKNAEVRARSLQCEVCAGSVAGVIEDVMRGSFPD